MARLMAILCLMGGLAGLLMAQATPRPEDNPYHILFDMHKGARQGANLADKTTGPQSVAEIDDETGYDVLYYNLEIRFNPTAESEVGRTDMQFVCTNPTLTDLAMQFRYNMVVDCVLVDGVETTFTLTWLDNFNVDLPATLVLGDTATLTTFYHGQPYGAPGGLGGMYFDMHEGAIIMSSLSEPEGARNWWPCKDAPHDKANSVRMVWTVPSGYYATGNGLLQSVTSPEPGWRSFEWVESYPITTYLVAATATNFMHWRDWYVSAGGDSLPLDYYIYPEDSLNSTVDFVDMPDIMGYFGSVFEEYPFFDEKYGQVEFPFGGAMEHQTLTSMGSICIDGSGTWDWIYAHEMSHQWWGDMVTCETWMDLWLNEGFATYCDALYTSYSEGWSAFQARMNSNKQYYFQADANWEGRFPIYDPVELWGATVYQKGSWILHMIRYVVGEDDFWNFWPVYRAAYAFDAVTDAEFQATLEAESGMDLDWFFDEWVYMAGYPEYQWGWQTTPFGEDSSTVNVSITQVQDLVEQTPIFTMPIQLKITKNTGQETVTVWNSVQAQNFSFHVSGTVTDVQFDPDNWILKTAQEGGYVGVTNPPTSPQTYQLAMQISPNPANPAARIAITLPAPARVSLAVYNLAGQKVATLVDGIDLQGENHFTWDGSGLASGMYLAKLETPTAQVVQKVMLLK